MHTILSNPMILLYVIGAVVAFGTLVARHQRHQQLLADYIAIKQEYLAFRKGRSVFDEDRMQMSLAVSAAFHRAMVGGVPLSRLVKADTTLLEDDHD